MGYVVTPLRLEEHREVLARLWAENMSDARIAAALDERRRWLYELAPDGPTTTVLVFHAESGEAVGCGSFIHRPTWVDGRRMRAGVLCDFAVAKAHRTAGAAIAIQRALVKAGQAAGLDFLYGFPNQRSLPIFKHVGYRVVGDATTWVKPLRSGYKLRELLPWRWAAALAGAPVDGVLRALDRWRAARNPLKVRAEIAPRPDPRADELWERVRAGRGVACERTAAYLAWRYGGFRGAEYSILLASAAGAGRLAGFAVFSLVAGKAMVWDLFAEDREDAADAVLLALARHLRSRGADSLYLAYVGSPSFGERLARLGFHERPGPRPLVLHPGSVPEELRPRLLDPASWLMLEGELDI